MVITEATKDDPVNESLNKNKIYSLKIQITIIFFKVFSREKQILILLKVATYRSTLQLHNVFMS